MSVRGWIRVDAEVVERLAKVSVCVGGRWGRPGETLAVQAGPVRVEVRAAGHAFPVRAALLVDAFVAPGRITRLHLPPFVTAYPGAAP